MTAATAATFSQPDAALAALCALVRPVEIEAVDWPGAAGRVLAEPIVLDRPSPAVDVSAMDGYAVRLADVGRGTLPVVGEVQAGVAAEALTPGHAVRIFTGAMVPHGTDAVIPREQLTEHADHIEMPVDLQVTLGQHIRRQGENAVAGQVIVDTGHTITAPVLAAIASCGKSTVQVRRRVRIGIIVTGGEICQVQDQPAPWQLRDSNGPALAGLLAGVLWLDIASPQHVVDQPAAIAQAINKLAEESDALLLTGGVSAGDYDHVPGVLRSLGANIVFHKLAIRPGKPVLGAIDQGGRPILALPGNPVSVIVTARRLAVEVLRVRAGISAWPAVEVVQVAEMDRAPAKLIWFALAQSTGSGKASLVSSKGSGDWVSAVGSDAFVEIPAGENAAGSRRFYRWNIAC